MEGSVESMDELSIAYSLIPYTADSSTLFRRRYLNGSIVINEQYLMKSLSSVEGAVKTIKEKGYNGLGQENLNKKRQHKNKKNRNDKKETHEYTCVGINQHKKIKVDVSLINSEIKVYIPVMGVRDHLVMAINLSFKERCLFLTRAFLKNKIFIAIKDASCDEVVNFMNGYLIKRIL